jgi:HNH endonuclease.
VITIPQKKTYTAVEKWLKERLSLDISHEKSGITNLQKNYMEFLGLKIRAVPKRNTYAVKSFMSDKAYDNAHAKVKECIKKVLSLNDQKSINKNVGYYNSLVVGLHNYYKMATHVSKDFSNIGRPVRIRLYAINHNNKGCTVVKTGDISSSFIAEKYGESKQLRWIGKRVIIPVSYVQHEYPKYKRREVNKYVVKSDTEYRVPNSINFEIVKYLMENAYQWKSIEFADNMLSRYIAQKGNCAVLRKMLYLHNMDCHHIKPRKGGFAENNSYQNLVLLTAEIHRLIHATDQKIIQKYLQQLQLDKRQLELINKFRIHVENEAINS